MCAPHSCSLLTLGKRKAINNQLQPKKKGGTNREREEKVQIDLMSLRYAFTAHSIRGGATPFVQVTCCSGKGLLLSITPMCSFPAVVITDEDVQLVAPRRSHSIAHETKQVIKVIIVFKVSGIHSLE